MSNECDGVLAERGESIVCPRPAEGLPAPLWDQISEYCKQCREARYPAAIQKYHSAVIADIKNDDVATQKAKDVCIHYLDACYRGKLSDSQQ